MSVPAAAANDSVLQRQMTLRDLLDLPSFQDVCKSFVDLYRIGIKVFDADGTKLVDIKTGSGDFCAYMFTKLPGKTLCTETVTHIKNHPLPQVPGPAGCETRDCFSGARYVMLPILHEGDQLGRVVFGPFVPDDLPDLGPQLMGLSATFDLDKARTLMARIRKAPEATARKVMEHFGKVLEVILFTSYRAALTSQLHIESISDSYRELQDKSNQLKESYERLKELDRLKSNFLATVSHELRTPLTSVIGYSEMLLAGLAGDLNAEQREYLGTILEKGESLLNLITSILDLSKIEARGVRLNVQPSDIAEVVKSAVSTVVPHAAKKQLELEVDVEPSLPPAKIDADKVRQALVNLLSNAVKFTPEGGRVIVRARLLREPARATPFSRADAFELSVTDTGVGIAFDQQEKIFDTFYQVDSSSTREFGGAGLGLSIVRSYAEAHGGSVQVESTPGRGSTFRLQFPLEPPSAGGRAESAS